MHPLQQFLQYCKYYFDVLLKLQVEETIIVLIKAVCAAIVDVSQKCKFGFANVKIMTAPMKGQSTLAYALWATEFFTGPFLRMAAANSIQKTR